MRSFSEMLIAIAVCLAVISAIFAARQALLSTDSRLPAERPAVAIVPPREVKASTEDAEGPPVPAAELAISPLGPAPDPALDRANELESLHL